MGASCYFIGHRETGENILPMLDEMVKRHITQYGVTDFYVGHYGGFDVLAAKVVRKAKEQYPQIRLMLVLPYHPAIQQINTPDGFDGTFYPWEGETIPRRLAIIKTNQRMVDICDYLIAYAYHFLGGTGRIVEYARKRERMGEICVTNLSQNQGAL